MRPSSLVFSYGRIKGQHCFRRSLEGWLLLVLLVQLDFTTHTTHAYTPLTFRRGSPLVLQELPQRTAMNHVIRAVPRSILFCPLLLSPPSYFTSQFIVFSDAARGPNEKLLMAPGAKSFAKLRKILMSFTSRDHGSEPDRRRYIYAPLTPGKQEIRLLMLYPGHRDDKLQVLINHVELATRQEQPSLRRALSEIQESLPCGWQAHRTLEDRILFQTLDDRNCMVTTWQHPNVNIDPKIYAQPPLWPEYRVDPKYEALSYVWGESVDTKLAIFVRDSTLNPSSSTDNAFRTLQISESLYSALSQLRYTDSPRVLWIDQLCINQSDIVERNEQVQIMRHIYRFATRVIAW